MSPESSTENYPAFAHIGLRENPGKNLNQVTCPDRESNPGHLVSRPDALTVTPQYSIVDPTIRFEVECHQSAEVHLEKKSIYEPTVNYFKLKYALIHVEEEKKELVGSLAEKKLAAEGCTGRNGEREKSSGQKKISGDRRH
ncbi:hypothetical protein ANN_07137 [Periplaneta americana]|uniref:Uncharacterized protein n=1 Tax=Periplaneta americana TaxID=6978 RepID=A0ABQ8TG45_PERAM|nr:hypothetical protein ANN_07137 [Periplaneta americana]